MKYLYLLLTIILIFSCNKTNDNYIILDGCYGGCFDFKDTLYWYSICFENNKYEEWPSGGAYFQKPMSCLTIGTYTNTNSKLTFMPDSFKFEGFLLSCATEMELSGVFTIIETNDNDSLIFEKGTGNNKIIYYLKK